MRYGIRQSKAQHAADTHGRIRIISIQEHYKLAFWEEQREMIPLCLDMGVGLIQRLEEPYHSHPVLGHP